jgi:uncharacterized coiled-coil DUF342 family protein
MNNITKAIKLAEAVELLAQADALVQQALGASDDCYDIHNTIETTIDTLSEYVEQLVEMQVTE